MPNKYTAPDFNKKSFTCPHCNTTSQIIYFNACWRKEKSWWGIRYADAKYMNVGVCQNCDNAIIWIDDDYIYPDIVALEPNSDMPDSVRTLYNEATLIYNKSPRAACALLRLAVERLCNELGETGKIDTMIGNLVKKGLPTIVQKALDAVRVIGNKAVHPGQIAFDVDDKSTAEMLMKLLNIITERLITEPKEIDGIFDALPQSAKESIEKRDK